MSRPASNHPTPAELEILRILWDGADSGMTVREVLDHLNNDRSRAYTTVMTLMTGMHEKGLLTRRAEGKAFRYQSTVPRQTTLKRLLGDFWQRAYGGSASDLVLHLLEETNPTAAELRAIESAIEEYREGTDRSLPPDQAGDTHD